MKIVKNHLFIEFVKYIIPPDFSNNLNIIGKFVFNKL